MISMPLYVLIGQGEWRAGVMEGVGVRVFKSGKLTAGRWYSGAVAEVLELSQCAAAVQAADRAAQTARQVKVRIRCRVLLVNSRRLPQHALSGCAELPEQSDIYLQP